MRSAFFNKLMSFLIKIMAKKEKIIHRVKSRLVIKGTDSKPLNPIVALVKFNKLKASTEIPIKI